MNHRNKITILGVLATLLIGCKLGYKKPEFTGKDGEVRLMVVDPGHFHADLLLKQQNATVNRDVFVYAPKGVGLAQHLDRIQSFNMRSDNPTNWNPIVYDGADFLEQMLRHPAGNVVVLAGNNRMKTDYLYKSVSSGLHVLADKPLAINSENFKLLLDAVYKAEKEKVMIFDMMTERFAILNVLQRAIMSDKSLFGVLQADSPEAPSVRIESVHHFFKEVAGKPLIRPAWYYDVNQQGEGLVDVTTHLIDIVHWKCYPEVPLDYKKDIQVLGATHWPTVISFEEFAKSTQMTHFPDYLHQHVKNGKLEVYANGNILYKVKETHVALSVKWNFEAPAGSGDTHTSVIKGTRAVIEVVQDESTGFVPELFLTQAKEIEVSDFMNALGNFKKSLQQTYPNIDFQMQNNRIRVIVPKEYIEEHEAQFARVAQTFFEYLEQGDMPEWEIPNMLSKYYITTTAFEMANAKMVNK
jgi:predicted dehydrogenase